MAIVLTRVSGFLEVEVPDDCNAEEAKKLANKHTEDADFGALKDVNWFCVNYEDKDGNWYLYE